MVGGIEMELMKPQINYSPAEIKINNIDDLKQEVANIANKYKDLVITESDYSQAKTDRAALNKARKKLDEIRIDKVKEFYKPIADFEDEMKSVKAIIDEVWQEVDNSVKEIELKQKQEKKYAVEKLIAEHSKGHYIEFDDRWLNRTYSLDNVLKDIRDQVYMTEQAQIEYDQHKQAIYSTCDNNGLTADGYISMLKKGFEFSDIMAEINEAISKPKEEIKVIKSEPKTFEETKTIAFEITVTKSQLEQLNEAFRQIGIIPKQISKAG